MYLRSISNANEVNNSSHVKLLKYSSDRKTADDYRRLTNNKTTEAWIYDISDSCVVTTLRWNG